MDNIFDNSSMDDSCEVIETILSNNNFRLERIHSFSHPTPTGEWYDQDGDEWVLLIDGTATLLYTDGRTISLIKGDHLFIPARCRHRVESVSYDAIWVALHYSDSEAK